MLVQQPKLKVGEIGSDPVSKLFTSIMDNSLRYMNIVPSGEDIVEATVIGDYTGKDSAEAIAQLKQDGFVPVIIGEGGKIDIQYPYAGTKLAEGSVVLLQTKGSRPHCLTLLDGRKKWCFRLKCYLGLIYGLTEMAM